MSQQSRADLLARDDEIVRLVNSGTLTKEQEVALSEEKALLEYVLFYDL